MTDITITLPDGATRNYPAGTTGGEVAADISKSLSKVALAVTVNGDLTDLSRPLMENVDLAIVTSKDDKQAEYSLELIRHDCAHIMARAVQEIWPDTKVTIGPVIENGFYYDFDREEPFSSEDLEKIEKKMREIIQTKDAVRTEV